MKKHKNEKEAVLRFSHQAMGTLFEIFLTDIDEKYGQQASQAVFEEIDRLENLLTRFNPCSDIGQINNLKPGQSCAVGVETFECLEKAFQIQKKTKGAFAVNYACLEPQGREERLMVFPLVLSRSSGRFMVTLKKERYESNGVTVDLGGIGKGLALDKAKIILNDWGIPDALIHGGTSTALALGNPSDKKGWAVGVSGDFKMPLASKKIVLRDRAVSGSGKQVKGEHIVDPRTGRPASGHKAAWVSHPCAATADALSTAFMVMSTLEAEDFCQKDDLVWALVILNNGNCKTFNQNII
ncbi:MAG TPA: FAD:protein FMN transferase [Acidobacteriota bacterium]|nr:FAD:protein FMN transferase [Acidobacteriota bacterium]